MGTGLCVRPTGATDLFSRGLYESTCADRGMSRSIQGIGLQGRYGRGALPPGTICPPARRWQRSTSAGGGECGDLQGGGRSQERCQVALPFSKSARFPGGPHGGSCYLRGESGHCPRSGLHGISTSCLEGLAELVVVQVQSASLTKRSL